MVDTNIVVDFANMREPFYEDARLLMALGAAREAELRMSSSQMTDLVYILSEGGKHELVPKALEQIRKLRCFIKVADVGPGEIDEMLDTVWDDPEDALLHHIAMSLQVDCIVSRDKSGFQNSTLPVLDCRQLFDQIEREHGIVYTDVERF